MTVRIWVIPNMNGLFVYLALCVENKTANAMQGIR